MSGQLRLEVDLPHYCGSCPLEVVCSARDLLPCQPRFGDPGYGGPNVLHPVRPDLGDYLAEVGAAVSLTSRYGDRSSRSRRS
jgi:hypothetical protein